MTPAEEFRDTARIVREYAGKAEAGRWEPIYSDRRWSVMSYSPRVATLPIVAELWGADEAGGANAQWISLLNPLIGEPLAVVFDSAAMNAEEIGADYRLLEVARLIRSQHEAMQGGGQS